MITPEDLVYFAFFDLAEVTSETSARQAISAAYYALFHAVALAGSELFAGPAEVRQRLARSYEHGAVQAMAGEIEKRSRRETLCPEILLIARTLKSLSEARQNAEYDLSKTISWEEANERVWEAMEACHALKSVKSYAEIAEFLVLPLLRDRNRRG